MPIASKWTAGKIKALKGRAKFACLTAYDCTTARLADGCGIPLLLVGDSLATAVLILFLTVWFAVGAGFVPAFISGAVLSVAGYFMLKSKKAH